VDGKVGESSNSGPSFVRKTVELVHVLRQLSRRRRWVIVAALVAALAATATSYQIHVAPPSLEKRSLGVGAASTQVLVDAPRSSLANLDEDPAPLSSRALVYAQAMSGLQARSAIARESGLPERVIVTKGPFSSDANRSNFQNQPSEPRANAVLTEGDGYRLVFDAQQQLPIISIYAQAPTADGAQRLANGASRAMRRYVTKLDKGQGKPAKPVVLRDLGPAEGGTVSKGVNLPIVVLAFIAVFGIGCVLIVLSSGFLREWRRLAAEEAAVPRPLEIDEEESAQRRLPGLARAAALLRAGSAGGEDEESESDEDDDSESPVPELEAGSNGHATAALPPGDDSGDSEESDEEPEESEPAIRAAS
jgi:hypothetical protein